MVLFQTSHNCLGLSKYVINFGESSTSCWEESIILLYWYEMFYKYLLGLFDLRCYLTLTFLNLYLCLNELLRYYPEKSRVLKSQTIPMWRPINDLSCSSVSFMNLVSCVWCTDVPFGITQFKGIQVPRLSVYYVGCAPMPGQPSFHSPQKYLVCPQLTKGRKWSWTSVSNKEQKLQISDIGWITVLTNATKKASQTIFSV